MSERQAQYAEDIRRIVMAGLERLLEIVPPEKAGVVREAISYLEKPRHPEWWITNFAVLLKEYRKYVREPEFYPDPLLEVGRGAVALVRMIQDTPRRR